MATVDPKKVAQALAQHFGGGGARPGGSAIAGSGAVKPIAVVRPTPIVPHLKTYSAREIAALRAQAARMPALPPAEKEQVLNIVSQVVNKAKTEGGSSLTRLREYINKLDPRIVAAIMATTLAADLVALGVFESDVNEASTAPGNGGGVPTNLPSDIPELPGMGGGSFGGVDQAVADGLMVRAIGNGRYELIAPASVSGRDSVQLMADYYVPQVELVSTPGARRFIQQLTAPFGGPRRAAQLMLLMRSGLTPEILVTLDDM